MGYFKFVYIKMKNRNIYILAISLLIVGILSFIIFKTKCLGEGESEIELDYNYRNYTALLVEIELYKVETGYYPKSIIDLKKITGGVRSYHFPTKEEPIEDHVETWNKVIPDIGIYPLPLNIILIWDKKNGIHKKGGRFVMYPIGPPKFIKEEDFNSEFKNSKKAIDKYLKDLKKLFKISSLDDFYKIIKRIFIRNDSMSLVLCFNKKKRRKSFYKEFRLMFNFLGVRKKNKIKKFIFEKKNYLIKIFYEKNFLIEIKVYKKKGLFCLRRIKFIKIIE